ncbi:diacylglycerol/lipid kinase family protein [Chitinophaga tropicalis]|uniref:diacylglycerol/lipid kinase family protein n=1 Tax=Chitinophaga tropicalis TaxID=2683588 RepID=UPI0012F7ACA2|nr:diacylglycerol kinase family protein [Chitinophaga tropicalis]
MRKILFIINRKAGTDREKRLEGVIRRYLTTKAFSIEIKHLEYLGHGTDLAREAVKSGIDTVVAVGGDGSINEIAQGLTGTDTALAIIPLGSGNGLARALKIPLKVPHALEVIANNRRKAIDVGYANEYMFLSNAGVGFDALIADQFRHTTKRGLWGYARLVIKGFTKYKGPAYSINIDGKTMQERAFLLTVANGNQFGYEFKLAPGANVFDGQLDLCVVPPIGFWGLIPIGLYSLLGNIDKTKYMQHLTGRDIVVKSEELAYLQVDGDAVPLNGAEQVRFRVQPGSLQVIVAQ